MVTFAEEVQVTQEYHKWNSGYSQINYFATDNVTFTQIY